MARIRKEKPAGGRGAIKASIRAFARQGIPVKLIASFAHANKVGGFDCPGCAFPDRKDRPLVDSCEQGQKAIAWEMTRKAVGAEFFEGRSPEELRALSDFDLEFQGRLTHPVLYEKSSGKFRALSWDEAYAVAARELHALDPKSVAFYASGRSSNEAAFLWQLAARAYGSPNLPDSSNFCHEPSGFALKQSIGTGKGTCTLEDFEHADLIVVIGQNPASNHPRMMAALYEARKRGAYIVAVNPILERGFRNFSDPKNVGELLRDEGIEVADDIYQVQVGGDMALFKGVMKLLLEMEGRPDFHLDREFIKQHTEGYDALRADLESCDILDLVMRCGIDLAKMRRLAERYAESPRTMFTWCMGLTHHPEAVATIQQVVNLAMLKGNIGRRGSGVMPVRGHSNVQGDRTMGATSTVSGKWLDNLECAFTGLKLARDAGRDAAATIQGLFDGQVRALLSLGGNFGVAAPDAPRVQEALSRCRFTLHIATKLNRTHCFPGEVGLLLPTLGRTDKDLRGGCEQTISTEDSSSTVRASHGLQHPISEQQRSEPAIVGQLADALGCAPMVPWLAFADDYAALRESIEQAQSGITAGFENFNEKLSRDGRFSLPNSAAERRWKTPSGKAQFRVHAFDENTPLRRARREHGREVLALMTIRAHDQFNTTVYSADDRYRDVAGDRRVVFLSKDTLDERGIRHGEKVDLEAICEDGIERIVHGFTALQYPLANGCAAAYYPEASGLVPAYAVSEWTHTPAYKEVPVRVRKSVLR